jgi:hypothetical protein
MSESKTIMNQFIAILSNAMQSKEKFDRKLV